MRERWRPGEARRIVDRRWSDGRLFLAVDEDPDRGYRIDAPEVGVHLVNAAGTEVFLTEPQGPGWFWQRLLFAQTLPIAAALRGLGLFHASAVRIGDRAVAISAPSGTGKSATAVHLIANGATFFTDDVLALEIDEDAVLAHAGPEFLNVDESEVRALEPGKRERVGRLLGESTKQHRRPAVVQTRLPLGAFYLMERNSQSRRVRVDPLDSSGVAALLGSAFVPHHGTATRLVGHLELCARMAAADQIYRVRVPLRGSAATVATALMNHATRLLKCPTG